MKAKITRLSDKIEFSGSLSYILCDEYGRATMTSQTPIVGTSICIDCEKSPFHKWLTSPITEVVSENEVKTKNSVYKIKHLS